MPPLIICPHKGKEPGCRGCLRGRGVLDGEGNMSGALDGRGGRVKMPRGWIGRAWVNWQCYATLEEEEE